MKRLMSLLLALVMVLGMIPAVATAETAGAEIYFVTNYAEGAESIAPGETFTVDVMIRNNPGFAGFQGKFTWKDVSLQNVDTTGTLLNGATSNNGKVAFYTIANVTGDGKLCTLEFMTPSTLLEGEYEIGFEIETICDASGNDLVVTVVPGSVKVVKPKVDVDFTDAHFAVDYYNPDNGYALEWLTFGDTIYMNKGSNQGIYVQLANGTIYEDLMCLDWSLEGCDLRNKSTNTGDVYFVGHSFDSAGEHTESCTGQDQKRHRAYLKAENVCEKTLTVQLDETNTLSAKIKVLDAPKYIGNLSTAPATKFTDSAGVTLDKREGNVYQHADSTNNDYRYILGLNVGESVTLTAPTNWNDSCSLVSSNTDVVVTDGLKITVVGKGKATVQPAYANANNGFLDQTPDYFKSSAWANDKYVIDVRSDGTGYRAINVADEAGNEVAPYGHVTSAGYHRTLLTVAKGQTKKFKVTVDGNLNSLRSGTINTNDYVDISFNSSTGEITLTGKKTNVDVTDYTGFSVVANVNIPDAKGSTKTKQITQWMNVKVTEACNHEETDKTYTQDAEAQTHDVFCAGCGEKLNSEPVPCEDGTGNGLCDICGYAVETEVVYAPTSIEAAVDFEDADSVSGVAAYEAGMQAGNKPRYAIIPVASGDVTLQVKYEVKSTENTDTGLATDQNVTWAVTSDKMAHIADVSADGKVTWKGEYGRFAIRGTSAADETLKATIILCFTPGIADTVEMEVYDAESQQVAVTDDALSFGGNIKDAYVIQDGESFTLKSVTSNAVTSENVGDPAEVAKFSLWTVKYYNGTTFVSIDDLVNVEGETLMVDYDDYKELVNADSDRPCLEITLYGKDYAGGTNISTKPSSLYIKLACEHSYEDVVTYEVEEGETHTVVTVSACEKCGKVNGEAVRVENQPCVDVDDEGKYDGKCNLCNDTVAIACSHEDTEKTVSYDAAEDNTHTVIHTCNACGQESGRDENVACTDENGDGKCDFCTNTKEVVVSFTCESLPAGAVEIEGGMQLYKESSMQLSASVPVAWEITEGADVISIAALTRSLNAKTIEITAQQAGEAQITATAMSGASATYDIQVVEKPNDDLTAAIKADKASAKAGETVNVSVFVEPGAEKTKYNAYEISVSYEGMTYIGSSFGEPGDTKQSVVKDNDDGTLLVYGYGAEKTASADEELVTLYFTAGAMGTANVSITEAKASDSAAATTENLQEINISEQRKTDEIEIYEEYKVTFSEGVTVGEDTVTELTYNTIDHANGIQFTVEPKAYHDTYTVEASNGTLSNEGNVYTLTGLTADATVTITHTPNTYTVSYEGNGAGDVTSGNSATYGEAFTVTINEASGWQYTVTADVEINDRVISGDKITQNIKVTVTKKAVADDNNVLVQIYKNGETNESDNVSAPKGTAYSFSIPNGYKLLKVVMGEGTEVKCTEANGSATTDVEVTGNLKIYFGQIVTVTLPEDNSVVGETTANYGTPYTFTIADNFELDKVTIGGVDYPITQNGDGPYTIPAEDITGDIEITTKAADYNVQVYEYVKGANAEAFMLVCAEVSKEAGAGLCYGTTDNHKPMYWSAEYTWKDDADQKGAYVYLVYVSGNETLTVEEATSMVKKFGAAENVEIIYGYDVNKSGAADLNDAQLTYDIYNVMYNEFTADVTMEKFLRADVNKSKNVDVQDAVAIVTEVRK